MQNLLVRRVLGTCTTALQRNVVQLLSMSKKVLEVITAQALKVSNDLVKVSVNVSQVSYHGTTQSNVTMQHLI